MSRTHSLTTAAVVALLGTACRPSAGEGHEGGHAHEAAALSVTSFAARTQLFAEFEPPVAGRDGKMAAHLTRLDGWKPLTEGKVTLLVTGGAAEQRFVATGASSPGIFRLAPRIDGTGKRRLALTIATAEGSDTHDLGEVEVFADEHAAAHAGGGEEEPAGLIPFLMEQQWKTEFGLSVAEPRPLRASVTASGLLRPRSDGEAHVTAPVAGRLVTAGAAWPRVGMQVQRDQVLAVLAPRLGADVDPATLELAVSRARVALELAQRERERAEALLAEQAVPERRVAEARAAETVAVEEHAAATRRLAQFQGTQRAGGGDAAGRIELRAPVSGLVVAVASAPGAFVAEGQELLHVVDVDRLWLEVAVPEADVGRLGRPAGAAFTVDGFERRFELPPGKAGAPIAIGGLVDPQSRTVPVVFEVPNPGRELKAGMFARARVFTGEARTALAIPASAVVDDGKQEVAYVIVSGEAYQRRPLRLGVRDGDLVEVLEGLSPGERVVSKGAWQVRLAAAGGALPAHGHVH
ncbi:MAG: efflux RND transporter periplasmic adaptor subunit [Anaeromyxobacteraceae bacterium]|nr:efflux RND transporter periplasmic adaptor subunit [Anaeromyxobacteraceae bacterium]